MTPSGNEQLIRAHAVLLQRLDSLAEHVDQFHGDVAAHHAQVDAWSTIIEAQSQQLVVLEGRLDRLVASVHVTTDRMSAEVARLTSVRADRGRIPDDLGARLDQTVERVELAKTDEQIDQRPAPLVEQVARTDDERAERLRFLERQAQEAVGGIDEALDSHKRELEAAVGDSLADGSAPIPRQATAGDNGLQAVEERLAQNEVEMSDLYELHAALDAGLGTLRSEIADVRSAVRKVAGDHAEILDRLEDLDRVSQAGSAEQGRGRKAARKAEVDTNLAAAVEAAQILAREHQQLKGQVARLEQASEAATAAAQASSKASEAAPLSNDVRLLQQQLAAQDEILASLSRVVEQLSDSASTPPSPKPRKARKG